MKNRECNHCREEIAVLNVLRGEFTQVTCPHCHKKNELSKRCKQKNIALSSVWFISMVFTFIYVEQMVWRVAVLIGLLISVYLIYCLHFEVEEAGAMGE
ncbi:hypothetical protein [Bacillus sp. Marseille-P3800]|uniref:hypothetical protein n=1 Tax=Bacillus sp. Marseille-P3800 TaxID=2014782 RepID=UPI000C0889F0|nr:hypothetical protein [Bacillus sp. Marseille-P3800]